MITNPETAAKQIHQIVIEAVSDSLGLQRGYFLTNGQNDYNAAHYRWLLYYFLRKHTTLSNADIVAKTGGKTSTQVIYGANKIGAELKIRDRLTVLMVRQIQELIESRIDKQNQMLVANEL